MASRKALHQLQSMGWIRKSLGLKSKLHSSESQSALAIVIAIAIAIGTHSG
jgi:hypothetical protein